MITTIDGKKYKVRLLTGGSKRNVPNEWDALMNDFKEDNALLHWSNMYSWCQDTIEGCSDYGVSRGYYLARYWYYNGASLQIANCGFRPVLEPLEADTLSAIADGSILCFGTLYMNDKAMQNPKNPVWDGDIPDYIPGYTLCIGNSSLNHDERIRWIKWRNLLVCDRNILKYISWNQLDTLVLKEKSSKYSACSKKNILAAYNVHEITKKELGKKFQFDLVGFFKERDEALLSMDKQKIIDYMEKYGLAVNKSNETVFWASVHKAILYLPTATAEQKKQSATWLLSHGFDLTI